MGREPVEVCPICLSKYEEPVELFCGHRFCEGCIKKHIETMEKNEPEEIIDMTNVVYIDYEHDLYFTTEDDELVVAPIESLIIKLPKQAPNCCICRNKIRGWMPLDDDFQQSQSKQSQPTASTSDKPASQSCKIISQPQQSQPDVVVTNSPLSQPQQLQDADSVNNSPQLQPSTSRGDVSNDPKVINIESFNGRGQNIKYEVIFSDGKREMKSTKWCQENCPEILDKYRKKKNAKNTANWRAGKSTDKSN